MTVTFRRDHANGSVWALYGPHDELKRGTTVTVTRADGTTDTKVVGKHYRQDGYGMVFARFEDVTTGIDTTAPIASARRAVAPAAFPEGYYAVPSDTGAPFRFYAIERPRRGRYAGRMIVRHVFGGHMGPRVYEPGASRVLDEIVTHGITETREAFAIQTGSCYVCNRLLTNPESIALGVGPTCRQRQTR